MIKHCEVKNSLFLITMNGECWPTVLTKVFRDVVCDSLSADKDENFSVLSADNIKMFDQLGAFLKVAADFDDLGYVMVCCELHRTNIDLDKVFQEILGELSDWPKKGLKRRAYRSKALHVLWPSRGKHERLTIGPNLANNFTNLRFETHI
jgi:hypothetical protein